MSKIFEALAKRGGAKPDVLAILEGVVRPDAAEPVSQRSAASELLPEAFPQEAALPPPKRSTVPAPATPAITGAAPATFSQVALKITPGSPLLPFDGSDQHAAEEYRIIRTKIIHHPRQPRMVAISSPQLGDGKSVNAINIAVALSLKREATVLLADADFRRPSIARLLGLQPSHGLSDVLSGDCGLEQAVLQVESYPNLFVLPAGTRPSNPTELLDSSRWRAVCDALRQRFRFIILDAPPIGLVADYDLLQVVSDGVLVIVRPDYTNRSVCMDALNVIPKGKLLGVVMNCVPDAFPWRGRRYGYSYRYGEIGDDGGQTPTVEAPEPAEPA